MALDSVGSPAQYHSAISQPKQPICSRPRGDGFGFSGLSPPRHEWTFGGIGVPKSTKAIKPTEEVPRIFSKASLDIITGNINLVQYLLHV